MRRLLLLLAFVPLGWVPAAHAQLPGGGQVPPDICAIRSLSYGTAPTTGSIAVAGGIGCFRFTGAAGDLVRVRLIRTAGTLDPSTGIAPPPGFAACAATTDDEFLCRLSTAGAHTMVVRDAAGTATGSYALSIQRLNNPVGCGTLSYGTTTTAGALAAGEAGCWRFTGAAGDQVRIRSVATSSTASPDVAVQQNGRTSCRSAIRADTCVLRKRGLHTIFVTDAAATGAGGYAISIQRLNDPVGCATLSFRQAHTAGTIAFTGETPCYRFTGSAGDTVHVRLERTSSTLNPVAEVLDPDGTRRCAPTILDGFSCSLAVSGTHTILVSDQSGTSYGDYVIAVQRLNNPVGCPTLSFGTIPTPTTIGANREVDCFRFDGAAGDRVRLAAIAFAGDRVLAEVLAPDGTRRCGPTSLRFTCALNQTGRHIIFVASDTRVATSSYSILIQRLNAPVTCRSISFGASPVATSVTAPVEADCYRLDGVAGDMARLLLTGTLRPHVVVFGPDGSQRCEARPQLPVLGFNCAFDVDGTHTILVEDDGGTLGGAYTIASASVNWCYDTAAGFVPPGYSDRGSIATAGELDCWYIGWPDPGRRLEVRVTRDGGTLAPVFELTGPGGARVCGPTTADEIVCTISADSPHHVLIGGTAAGRTGAYEIELRYVS